MHRIVLVSQLMRSLVPPLRTGALVACCLVVYFAAGLALLVAALTQAGLVAIAAPLVLRGSDDGGGRPNSMALALEPYPRTAGACRAFRRDAVLGRRAIVALLGVLHDGSALPMAYIVAALGARALASTSRPRAE